MQPPVDTSGIQQCGEGCTARADHEYINTPPASAEKENLKDIRSRRSPRSRMRPYRQQRPALYPHSQLRNRVVYGARRRMKGTRMQAGNHEPQKHPSTQAQSRQSRGAESAPHGA